MPPAVPRAHPELPWWFVPRDIEQWFAEQQGRDQRRDDACRLKQWFATEPQARSHALMQRTQYGEQRHAYRCPVCDGWHLSRKAADAPAPPRD